MTPDAEISIDTDENYETITITFKNSEDSFKIGFSIGNAQLLNSYLSEAITAVLMHHTSSTRH